MEPGGGWRGRGGGALIFEQEVILNLTQESESESKLKTVVFYFHTITSDFNQFVSCGLAEQSRNQFSAELIKG